jgi:hypothetical protein
LIAASTRFELLSVDSIDISLRGVFSGAFFLHLLILELNDCLYSYDFNVDHRPLPFLVWSLGIKFHCAKNSPSCDS